MIRKLADFFLSGNINVVTYGLLLFGFLISVVAPIVVMNLDLLDDQTLNVFAKYSFLLGSLFPALVGVIQIVRKEAQKGYVGGMAIFSGIQWLLLAAAWVFLVFWIFSEYG